MSGLGGLNKAPDGVVIGVVQLQNPWLVTQEDLVLQSSSVSAGWCAKRGMTCQPWT